MSDANEETCRHCGKPRGKHTGEGNCWMNPQPRFTTGPTYAQLQARIAELEAENASYADTSAMAGKVDSINEFIIERLEGIVDELTASLAAAEAERDGLRECEWHGPFIGDDGWDGGWWNR